MRIDLALDAKNVDRSTTLFFIESKKMFEKNQTLEHQRLQQRLRQMTKNLPEQQLMKNLRMKYFYKLPSFHSRSMQKYSRSTGFSITEQSNNRSSCSTFTHTQQTTRICGVGGNEVCDNNGQVHLLIRLSNNEPISIIALILQKLSNHLPSRRIKIDNWTTVKKFTIGRSRIPLSTGN